jgi:SAM-dependent methyltransferase
MKLLTSDQIFRKINKSSIYAWILFILLLVLLIISIYNKNKPIIEGFTQNAKFVTKRDGNIYDSFYSNIYDELFFKSFSTNYEIGTIVSETSPTKDSKILDIGCRTGNVVGLLESKGYTNIIGLDPSKAIIEVAREKYPNSEFQVGNPLKSMMYTNNSFSHIFLLNMNIYQFKNQRGLLQNCYDWLMPGGYLVVNLVNKDKFNPLPPATNPLLLISPQRFAKKRITTGTVVFNNFNYESNFSVFPNDKVMFREIFKDTTTDNVRENELGLYMPKQKVIVSMALEIGFNVLGKMDLVKGQKEYQYLYIFYKPN